VKSGNSTLGSRRIPDWGLVPVALGLVVLGCSSGLDAPPDTNSAARGLVAEFTVPPTDTNSPGSTGASATTEAFVTSEPAATADPIETPEATPKPLSIRKIALTASVSNGGTAKVTIKTEANARCSIDVTYNSGSSTAAGLVDKTASAQGGVTWSWTVGTQTANGTYPIDIWCTKGDREGGLSLTFSVT
jgi:hypothetical protein